MYCVSWFKDGRSQSSLEENYTFPQKISRSLYNGTKRYNWDNNRSRERESYCKVPRENSEKKLFQRVAKEKKGMELWNYIPVTKTIFFSLHPFLQETFQTSRFKYLLLSKEQLWSYRFRQYHFGLYLEKYPMYREINFQFSPSRSKAIKISKSLFLFFSIW